MKLQKPSCLYDTHIHLADPRLATTLTPELDAARRDGVAGWLSCALSDEECDFHERLDMNGVRWCAGVHPHWPPSTPVLLPRIEQLAESGQLAAIGEIGLDRRGDIESQRPLLERQLALASDLRLPAILHCVRAWNELRAVLRRFPGVRCILHGFNANADVVDLFSGLDMAFSLGGGVTQRPDAEQVVRRVLTHGRLLLETDAPWQKPRWLYGEHNRPANLRPIAERIAALGGVELDTLMALAQRTANDLEIL